MLTTIDRKSISGRIDRGRIVGERRSRSIADETACGRIDTKFGVSHRALFERKLIAGELKKVWRGGDGVGGVGIGGGNSYRACTRISGERHISPRCQGESG